MIRIAAVRTAWIVAALAIVSGCRKERQPRVRLVAHYVRSLPPIDGCMESDAWAGAQVATLLLVRRTGPKSAPKELTATVRALHTDDALAVLVQWFDPTKSAWFNPFVWDNTLKRYRASIEADDEVWLLFDLKGRYANLLRNGAEYRVDVWEWGAGRTDPTGYARDALLVLAGRKFDPEARRYLHRLVRRSIWMREFADEGRPAVKVHVPTSFVGERVLPYAVQKPTGSAADVRARGLWTERDSRWCVEFARKLDTGHADDVVIDPARPQRMSVAIARVDKAGREAWYQSPQFELVLGGKAHKWTFDDCAKGQRVSGFEVQKGNWVVKPDPTAPSAPHALGQVAAVSAGVTPRLIFAGGVYADVCVQVNVRILCASRECAAGLVFREWNPANYYVAALDAARGQMWIARVANGQTVELARAKAQIEPDRWHLVRVECRGKDIRCYLDGRCVLVTTDSTFPNGRVGLWTQGNTVANFDDFEVTTNVPEMTHGNIKSKQ